MKENLGQLNTAELLCLWPKEIPFIYFRHGDHLASLPVRFSMVDLREVSDSVVYMGCLPFDRSRSKSFTFQVHQEILWNFATNTTSLVTHSNEKSDFNFEDFYSPKTTATKDHSIAFRPFESDESHLTKIQQVIRDIKKGRYYQLNLLRYFDIEGIDADQLIVQTLQQGGSHTALLKFEDKLIASFSPERFVKWSAEGDHIQVQTFPIKGTVPVHASDHDLMSQKIRAELNIIVDLMRNDLHRICVPHSVKVVSSDLVMKTHYVKHLYAKIIGRLRENLSLTEIFSEVLPAGSITGAPKIEVMKAIREYESHERGYSMGNFFYFDPRNKYFDSSVSIRTFQANLKDQTCLYAAGGGITVKSDPREEIEEIWDKCKVIQCETK